MASLNDLSLRQLEYVVAVAETLGFRRAAERCHVSQPALSAQIQQLEAVLGVKLFERDARRVLLTPEGRELVARARRVLTEAEDLLTAAARMGDPFAGPLHLGAIPTVAPYVLPEVVPALVKRYPKLRLRLREEKTALLMRDMDEGRLDAALLAVDTELGRAVEHEVIAEDPFVVAAPPGHPLEKKQQVQLRDLDEEEVLLLEDGHCFRSQTLALCTRVGAREVDFRATSLTTLAQMVMAAGGITLLPKLAVPMENRQGQLVVRPFAPPGPGRTLALAWRPGHPRAEALRAIAGTLRSAWPGGAGRAKVSAAAARK
ncbi:LysR substrate-binding domain-containing protein [Corallococcus sp. Z5C101001]|uniref:LysR substrate-binding domain-containing protein n=1 Tax=Corallococcus sp. Z5C101001 TaxID=2596829 RepID=UPI00117D3C46|nr:LysR substrate-binding domain-containing protein [Corallococcus sp. Z5C101001]TSC25228.1 LysR family transcriptional regulator [Corallococcus sp. Z5C101001]